ncbi:MAG: class I SAM-dependent methyltransferase [Verrucomicrobiota bacterium]
MTQPYLSLEAELHDAFWDAEDDGSEVRLMADFLIQRPGLALEIGSGSGRLMFPLLELGFAVEGLELSEDMIALGRARAERMDLSPSVHQGDMTQWDDGRKFANVLAPAFTLQLASDAAAALLHWHELLEDGGGLYLTVFMPYAELLGDLPEDEWYEDHRVTLPDGREGLLETRHRLDLANQVVAREHRYTLDGFSPHESPRSHVSSQRIRWFEHSELVALLKRCGFRVDGFFLDFDPEHVAADPDRVNFDGILTYHATRVAR